MWETMPVLFVSLALKSLEQTHARAEHMALYCYKTLLRYAEILEPGFLG